MLTHLSFCRLELSEARFNGMLKSFAKKHKPAEYAHDVFVLQPLREIHFDSRFGNFRGHTLSHSLITALSLIGLFLIIIACVNFINLATAQAVNRAKEVGVRKVLGSSRKQLAVQFVGETTIIVSCALVIAIVIAITSAQDTMMVVSPTNWTASCFRLLPSTFLTPTSFARLTACAVARLIKFTQAMMIRKSRWRKAVIISE